MEAKVQYNDFKGTVAADGIDPHSAGVLVQFLEEKGIDTERYNPVGFDFYTGEREYCSFSIICIDNQEQNLVKFGFEKKQTLQEFFNLFKRFNVIGISKYARIEGLELKPESIMIEDRE
ncbi:hypothetical protein [Dysgonomonas sp. HGC4]|uniref:hypothetical protein n=1 Tax=Dysgonomonas sp. HGC4 TaxID=1658009 RepID=UPI00068013D1|nr:hypothetical protein [Dysgonomonas sp. HGC4]MBD8348950.1 hypothetical protein [Dysgonomonas sp. HGC4]